MVHRRFGATKRQKNKDSLKFPVWEESWNLKSNFLDQSCLKKNKIFELDQNFAKNHPKKSHDQGSQNEESQKALRVYRSTSVSARTE